MILLEKKSIKNPTKVLHPKTLRNKPPEEEKKMLKLKKYQIPQSAISFPRQKISQPEDDSKIRHKKKFKRSKTLFINHIFFLLIKNFISYLTDGYSRNK